MDSLYHSARTYLRNHNVLCLATSDDELPWVAPVFYAVWSCKLVFLSAPHTLHCKNLSRNANVAASIQEDYRDWPEIKGFQLKGLVSAVSDTERSAAIAAYSEKFPVTGVDAPAEIANALDRVSWFSITVRQIYFIDNSKGLGHREELDPVRLFAE